MYQMTHKQHTEKLRRRQERISRQERLTNWYMINLSWGIVGIIALLIMGSLYRSSKILVYMQSVTWALTAIFAVAAIAVFALGKAGKIRNASRAVNYSIFLGVCAVGALWLSLYNRIRPLIESAARAILRNDAISVASYWNIRIPIIAIAVYLIIAFIIYTVKISNK